MKNKTVSVSFLIILSLCIFVCNCAKTENRTDKLNKDYRSVQSLTGEEISQLKIDETVRFPAILVKRDKGDCVELFTAKDFSKYNGDSKWAILSRLALNSNLSDSFDEKTEMIVTGKMIFVKGVADTSKTCGILVGNLFEISNIENF